MSVFPWQTATMYMDQSWSYILGSRRCPRSCSCRGGWRCCPRGRAGCTKHRPTQGHKLPGVSYICIIHICIIFVLYLYYICIIFVLHLYYICIVLLLYLYYITNGGTNCLRKCVQNKLVQPKIFVCPFWWSLTTGQWPDHRQCYCFHFRYHCQRSQTVGIALQLLFPKQSQINSLHCVRF